VRSSIKIKLYALFLLIVFSLTHPDELSSIASDIENLPDLENPIQRLNAYTKNKSLNTAELISTLRILHIFSEKATPNSGQLIAEIFQNIFSFTSRNSIVDHCQKIGCSQLAEDQILSLIQKSSPYPIKLSTSEITPNLRLLLFKKIYDLPRTEYQNPQIKGKCAQILKKSPLKIKGIEQGECILQIQIQDKTKDFRLLVESPSYTNNLKNSLRSSLDNSYSPLASTDTPTVQFSNPTIKNDLDQSQNVKDEIREDANKLKEEIILLRSDNENLTKLVKDLGSKKYNSWPLSDPLSPASKISLYLGTDYKHGAPVKLSRIQMSDHQCYFAAVCIQGSSAIQSSNYFGSIMPFESWWGHFSLSTTQYTDKELYSSNLFAALGFEYALPMTENSDDKNQFSYVYAKGNRSISLHFFEFGYQKHTKIPVVLKNQLYTLRFYFYSSNVPEVADYQQYAPFNLGLRVGQDYAWGPVYTSVYGQVYALSITHTKDAELRTLSQPPSGDRTLFSQFETYYSMHRTWTLDFKVGYKLTRFFSFINLTLGQPLGFSDSRLSSQGDIFSDLFQVQCGTDFEF